MSRIPMPRMSFLMLALGGALLLGQQVSGVSLDDAAPTTVLTVPAANVAPAGSGLVSVADMRVDDAATPVLR